MQDCADVDTFVRAKVAEPMQYSTVLGARERVIVSQEIDAFFRSTTVEPRLNNNTVKVLDRSAVLCVVKIDLVLHYEANNE